LEFKDNFSHGWEADKYFTERKLLGSISETTTMKLGVPWSGTHEAVFRAVNWDAV
jgi:hypothetical protein